MDQTAALVYADVGSTLSRNPNTNVNISLQLDDDCVHYADLKHHQTPELHQKECNSHTGMVPCPIASFPAPPSAFQCYMQSGDEATVPQLPNSCLLYQ